MWANVTLSELFDIGSSKRVLKSQWQSTGVPFYRGREITRLSEDGFVDNELFISEELYRVFSNKSGVPTQGDIVITAIGTIGNSYIVRETDHFYFKDASVLWLKKASEVSSEFINYWLKSAQMKAQLDEGNGATVDTLTIRKLQALRLKLPTLAEQKRIVAILNEAFAGIDAAIANTEKNLANARELFESYLESVFNKFNRVCSIKEIGSMCERITKGSSPKWQGISYINEPGVLFVTSENVGENELIFGRVKYVEEKFNQKDSKSILRRGDVLTNIVGASIGRTAVFDKDDLANINQAVCLMRCNAEELFNYYLAYLMNSPFFRRILHDNEVNNARANLSLGFFKSLAIPVPPVSEQVDIVLIIDKWRKQAQLLESIYNRKLDALRELKQSLLRKAFSGELTAENMESEAREAVI